MENRTSFTYTIENKNNKTIKELQYSDYSKSTDNEENMLLYKNVINDDEILESFNKLFKYGNDTREIVGNSRNKSNWKIRQYNNSTFERKYVEDYDRLNFNINYEALEKLQNQNRCIKDKME
jgi:hypothetical protein